MTKKELNKKYFKASLIIHSDEEALYNNFYIYALVMIQLIAFIVLQGELNTIAYILLVILCIILCKTGYLLGQNSNKSNPLRSDKNE